MPFDHFSNPKMTSRDALAIGTDTKPPVLFRGDYPQWRDRFLDFIERHECYEQILASLEEGPAQFWQDVPAMPNADPPVPAASKLKEKYKEVFLIRNERKVKIVEINGVRGFMPDFLLYMKDEDFTYQVFLEPKGSHLQKEDEWKEEFLLSLSTRSDIEVLSENEKVRLLGIKFFSSDREIKQQFREDFQQKLLYNLNQ